jgi:hypothetical protein
VATTPVIERFLGDTNVGIQDQILVGGSVFDFSGAGLPHLRVRAYNATTQLMDVTAAWSSITTGQVQYTPGAGDVIITTAGLYTAWWYVPSMPTGKPQTGPPFYILVSDPLAVPTNADLCTIQDVRSTMELQVADQTRDPVIAQYISDASQAIMRYTDREFAPASTGLTRTFAIDISGGDLVVELNPYDLRVATTVTLSPEGVATVLDSTMYSLEPVTNPDGVYKRIAISPFVGGVISTWALKFGYAKLAIQGNWGYATVPLDVKVATVQTVRSWLDRSVTAWGLRDTVDLGPGMNPQADGSYGIPPSALRTLSTYRRMVP